jgi:hypothetical protein
MKKIIIFSLLLLTVVIFRSPSLVNPVVDEDEAWYYSAAMIINSDGVLYKDAVDLKPPLIFYTFAMFMKMDDSMIFITYHYDSLGFFDFFIYILHNEERRFTESWHYGGFPICSFFRIFLAEIMCHKL